MINDPCCREIDSHGCVITAKINTFSKVSVNNYTPLEGYLDNFSSLEVPSFPTKDKKGTLPIRESGLIINVCKIDKPKSSLIRFF